MAYSDFQIGLKLKTYIGITGLLALAFFFLSIFNTQQKNIIRAGRWLQSSQLQLKKPFYKNHSELSALLGQRLPHLAPNPQGRKGKEETKIVLLRSLNRNTGAELGSVTRDVVLHMKN